MRRIILNAVIGATFGAVLAAIGFTFLTWQYWVLFGLLVAAIINSMIETL